jgi:hypothetical protein
MEAAKLGITAAEVPSKIKMQEAAAWKYTHPTASAGMPKGIASNVADKVLNTYEGYASNPKSATFYNDNISIPTKGGALTWTDQDRKYMDSSGQSKANAMQKWNAIVEAKKNERLSNLYNLGGRQTAPSVYSADE